MCAMGTAGNFSLPCSSFPGRGWHNYYKSKGHQVLYMNFKNGWINEDIFVEWLKHFAAYAKPTQESSMPLILD